MVLYRRVRDVILWLPRNRNLFVFWSGQLVSNVGDRIHWLAVGLLVVELTGSALQTGVYYALVNVPEVVLGFVAGTVADRVNRRLLMASMDTARAVLVALIPVLALTGHLRIEAVYGIVVALAVCNVFFDTASGALIPQIVAREELASANSALSLNRELAFLVGPAVGGVLVSTWGTAHALWTTAAGYAASALAVTAMQVPPGKQGPAEEARGFVGDLVEGIRYGFTVPVVRAISAKSLLANWAWGASIAILIYHFRANVGLRPQEIGLGFAAVGVASVTGAAAGASIGRYLGWGRGATLVTFLGVLGLLVLASVPSFWGLVLGGALGGFTIPVANINYTALRQSVVPQEMQGRAWAFERTVSLASYPLGNLFGGVLAQLLSAPAVFVLCSLLLALSALAGWFGGLRAFAEVGRTRASQSVRE